MKRLWEKIVALAGSNFGLKVLALVIALGLWLGGHRDIERAVEVPVEFSNIPPDLMVMDNRVDYVVLRLTGPRTLVSTLDPDELKKPLDVAEARSGSASYLLSANSFKIPRGVTVARITPPVVHLRLEPVMKRTLPVAVRFSGKPSATYKIAQTTVQPEAVSVQGPADDVGRLTAAETVPIDLEEKPGLITRKARLATSGKPFSFFPDQVEVSILLEIDAITREFGRVNVQARDFAGVYSVNPKSVYLKLSGPKNVLGTLQLGVNQVYLDLKGQGIGDHSVALKFDLPPGVRVVEQKPERFTVKITKPAA